MSLLSGLYGKFIAPYLVIILAVVLAITAGFAAYQTVRIEGLSVGPFKIIGLSDQVETLGEVKGALGKSEAHRVEENAQSQTSYASQQERCTDRIVRITEAGKAIKEIIHEPYQGPLPEGEAGDHVAPDLCLRGPPVGALQLRRVAGQAGGSPTNLLPSGSVSP